MMKVGKHFQPKDLPFAQKVKVKELIKAYGFKLSEVAEEMGITRKSMYNNIANGNYTITFLQRIALVIGCNDLREFFTEVDGTWIVPTEDNLDAVLNQQKSTEK